MIHGGGSFHDVEVAGLVFTIEITSPGYPARHLEPEEPPTWAVYAIDGRRVSDRHGTILERSEEEQIHEAVLDLVYG